jgi:hypothetical protein
MLTAGALVLLLLGIAGCRTPSPSTIRTVDLLKRVDHAEKRPSAGPFQLAEHTFGGLARASIVAPVPSRLTWNVVVPRRSMLRVDAAVPAHGASTSVSVRLGVSDDRVYEQLLEREITSAESAHGWTTLAVDLSAYAGTKLSLFYHPDGRTWHIVLATDPREGTVREIYWGNPGIDTDAAAAREYFRRQSGRGK